MNIFHLFNKNKEKLAHTLTPSKNSLWTKIHKSLAGKTTIDDQVLDQLEEVLIAADVGIHTTIKIIKHLEKRVASQKYMHIKELATILQEEIAVLLTVPTEPIQPTTLPHIILVTGVNGVGKTTTIGKLAALYKQTGKKVILGAADTFRAAAIAQLQLWGERVGVPVIAHPAQTDSSAIAYETVQQALKLQTDVAIIDTAGRLHTKVNLMHELAKIQRTIAKLIPTAPHEVLLVLDATTGQNALIQTKAFKEATTVTGLVITKLDGTAKGGVIIGIIDEFHIPVKYIGVGEKVEDLQIFSTSNFIEALLKP